MLINSELYLAASGLKEASYSAANFVVGVLLIFVAFQLVKVRGPVLSLFTDWLDEVIRILTMTEKSIFGGTMQGYESLTPNQLGGVGMDGKNGAGGDNFAKGMGQTAAQASAGGGYGMPASGSPADGGVTGGSMKRSNRLSNPQGTLGKLRNAKAIYNDQKRARLARRGGLDDPSRETRSDGLAAGLKTLGAMAIPKAMDAVDSAMGTHMGNDLRGIFDANLDDDLSKFDQNSKAYEMKEHDESSSNEQELSKDKNDINDRNSMNDRDLNYDGEGNQVDEDDIQETFTDSDGNALTEFVNQQGDYVPSGTVVGDPESGYHDLEGNEVYTSPVDKVFEDEDGNMYTPGQVSEDENGNLVTDSFVDSDVTPVAGTEGMYRSQDGKTYNEDDVFKENGQNFVLDDKSNKVPVSQMSGSGEYRDSDGNIFNANDSNTEILSKSDGSLYARTKSGTRVVKEATFVDRNGNSYGRNELKRAYRDSQGNITKEKYSNYRASDGTIISPESIKRDKQGNLMKDEKGYILKNAVTNKMTGNKITRARGGQVNRLINPKDKQGNILHPEYVDANGNRYSGNEVANKFVANRGNKIVEVTRKGNGGYFDASGEEYSSNNVHSMSFAKKDGKIIRVNSTGKYVNSEGTQTQVASSMIGAIDKNGNFVNIAKRPTKKMTPTSKTLTNSGMRRVSNGHSSDRETMVKRRQQANKRLEQVIRDAYNTPHDKSKLEAVKLAKYHRKNIIQNMDIRDLPKDLGISKKTIERSSSDVASKVMDVRNDLYQLQKAKERVHNGLGKEAQDTVRSLQDKLNKAGVKKDVYNKNFSELKYTLRDLDKYIKG